MKQLLYLSAQDVRGLELTPAAARTAVIQAFRAHKQDLIRSLPKSSLELGPGHGFQAMVSASAPDGVAALKWVAMAPVAAGDAAAGINGLICLNEYGSGAPIAVMDGNELTLIRTAAMSAAAAAFLAPESPRTLGMIGCGLQAYVHLAAFADLFPSLKHVLAHSRSMSSAQKLADAAHGRGLSARAEPSFEAVLAQSDIVVTMVPGAPGLVPFLDARLLQPHAFVAAVDIGRSWLPESFPAFDLLATDSLAQSKAPYDVNGRPVTSAYFHTDLAELCSNDPPPRAGRRLFCFRGFAVADLALANLALRQARDRGVGITLPR